MSDSESLLPVYHNHENSLKMFKRNKICSVQIHFPKFGWASICFSFFSFFFCVIWSIAYNFEEATATHCSVKNYLPSISAAIGHFYPQILVWDAMIILQLYPRMKISTMYLHYYCSVIYDNCANLYSTAWIFSMCEIWSLLGLSLITSTTNYTLHAVCFSCFLFTSIFNMILTCYLLKFKRKIPAGNVESRTLRWKFHCCIFNILCFIMAGYFFKRHNTYCEPKVYSIFALFEYGVVLSNMVFHQLAIWDFHDRTLTFSLTFRGIELDYNPPFKSIHHSNIK